MTKIIKIGKNKGVHQSTTATYNDAVAYSSSQAYGGGDTVIDEGPQVFLMNNKGGVIDLNTTTAVFSTNTTTWSDTVSTWADASVTWGGGDSFSDSGPTMIGVTE